MLWQSANGFLSTGCNTGRIVAAFAKGKKGKKGKKPKQQKKSGMDWARDFEVMPYDSSSLRPLASDAAGAFEARTGTVSYTHLTLPTTPYV